MSDNDVESLQQKLKWYVENQELLDRDAALLKQKDADITQLTEKLQQLRTDVSGIDIVICVWFFTIYVSVITSILFASTSYLDKFYW